MRAKFSREAITRDWTFQEFLTRLRDAAERSGLPIARSGAAQRLRIVPGPPLPQGQTSRCEYVDFEIAAPLAPREFAERLRPQLPEGVELLWQRRVPANAPSLKAAVRALWYRVEGAFDPERLAAFHAAEAWPMDRVRKDVARRVDLKRRVGCLELEAPGLLMQIAVYADGALKPAEVAASVFGLTPEQAARLPMERAAIAFAPEGRPRSLTFA